MRALFVSTACLAAFFLSACNSTPVRLDSTSDRPVPAGTSRDLQSKACGFQLLLLIPIQVNTRQLRAHRQLAAQAGGDYITDVEVQEEWGYRLVGTEYCTHMRAKAIGAAG